MKFNSTFVFLIAGLALGFFAGKFYSNQDESKIPQQVESSACEPAEVKNCEEFENLKSKLDGISPDEIRAYLQSQSADEKLKRADEILGKIMTALVATVGYRLQKQDLEQFGKAQGPIDTQPKAKPLPVAKPSEAPLEKTQTTTHPTAELSQIGQDSRQARTEMDAVKVLDIKGDVSKRIQGAGLLNNQQVRLLNGRFEGLIALWKGQDYRMVFEFNGRNVNKSTMGRARVEIFEGNKKRTSISSQGDISKNFSAMGDVIYIDAGTDYIELIYFPQLEALKGNFYQLERGVLTKTGNVHLRKTGN